MQTLICLQQEIFIIIRRSLTNKPTSLATHSRVGDNPRRTIGSWTLNCFFMRSGRPTFATSLATSLPVRGFTSWWGKRAGWPGAACCHRSHHRRSQCWSSKVSEGARARWSLESTRCSPSPPLCAWLRGVRSLRKPVSRLLPFHWTWHSSHWRLPW